MFIVQTLLESLIHAEDQGRLHVVHHHQYARLAHTTNKRASQVAMMTACQEEDVVFRQNLSCNDAFPGREAVTSYKIT